jgi:hypothetical protein
MCLLASRSCAPTFRNVGFNVQDASGYLRLLMGSLQINSGWGWLCRVVDLTALPIMVNPKFGFVEWWILNLAFFKTVNSEWAGLGSRAHLLTMEYFPTVIPKFLLSKMVFG